MKILNWDDFASGEPLATPLAATVGVFDGLHIGHRKLIESVLAHGKGRLPAVFTFRDSPKQRTRPGAFRGALSTLDQKLEGLEALGLGLCVLIDFSGNFSKLAGRDFLSILRIKGNLGYMAVGSNFSCGYRLDTHAGDVVTILSEYGIKAEVLEPVLWEGHPVSSSRIRTAIGEGRLADAEAMMGRPYELDLAGATWQAREDGRFSCGLPEGVVLPPPGCYEGRARGKGSWTEVRLGVLGDRLELAGMRGGEPLRVAMNKLTLDK
jgi:riboflavin kinase/FMN adenylyltransferase